MSDVKLSTEDKLASVLLSALAGVLVGAVFAAAGAGLFWWSEISLPRPSSWFVVSVVAVGTTTFFVVLWQFISGNLFPGELWRQMGGFFTDGNDSST